MNNSGLHPEMRGSGPVASTVDVVSDARAAQAVELLFKGGYDTVEIASLFKCGEPEVVAMLHADRRVIEGLGA